MTKYSILFLSLLINASAFGAEPARRPTLKPRHIPANVVCRDDIYQCMYNCVAEKGAICAPARGSDRNCRRHQVVSGRWVLSDVIVLRFTDTRQAMACSVISPPKVNLHCRKTKLGDDCWIGPMRVNELRFDF